MYFATISISSVAAALWLLGAACGSALYETRVTAADAVQRRVAAVVDRLFTDEFAAFYRPVEATMDCHRYRIAGSDLDHRAFTAYDSLWWLQYYFAMYAKAYLTARLREYIELAVGMLREGPRRRSEDDEEYEARMAAIAFSDRHRWSCPLTAFLDLEIDADLLLRVNVFFRTVGTYDRRTELAAVVGALADLGHAVDADDDGLKVAGYGPRPPPEDPAHRIAALARLKRELADFAEVFCSSWTPAILGGHFGTAAASDVQQQLGNKSRFVRHVFRTERCEIAFKKDYLTAITNNIIEIRSWSCNNILKTPEYRCREHKEDTIVTNSPTTEGDNLLPEKITVSLVAFKEQLRFHSHYLNLVKYYNIAADAMLLSSVKEGEKMLYGIKLSVQINCTGQKWPRKTADEMLGRKSSVMAFKSVLDKLVDLLSDEKRIKITMDVRHRKTYYDKRADSVAKSFQRDGDDDRTVRICGEIPKALKSVGGNACLGDNPDDVEFEQFYFAEPLLNIRNLYLFVLNDFE